MGIIAIGPSERTEKEILAMVLLLLDSLGSFGILVRLLVLEVRRLVVCMATMVILNMTTMLLKQAKAFVVVTVCW